MNEIENLIRLGKTVEARLALKKVDVARLPRRMLAKYGSLARRTQQVAASLRALRPYVRPVIERAQVASAAERTEYALALRHLGAQREAESILSNPDMDAFPQAVLARGFLSMHKWEYESALAHIDRYLGFSEVGDYERLVAQVNRLACANFLGLPSFAKDFADLRTELQREGHTLLLANTLELYAQYLAVAERWDESRETLLSAKKLIDANSGRSSLYIDKWLSLQAAFAKKSPDEILLFRAKALEQREWETIRDLDYNLAKLDPTSFWADRAYFGSPYATFRARMLKLRDFPSEKWLCESGDPVAQVDVWFPKDIEDSLTHRFLVSLFSDLYKPQTVGSVFSNLYPNEYFDYDVAGKRVRQLIKRLRDWIDANQYPVELVHENGLYSLKMGPSFGWLARARQLDFDPTRFYLGRFQKAEAQSLSLEEWAVVFGQSKSYAQKKLREGEAVGLITREGKARYLRYKLSPGSDSPPASQDYRLQISTSSA